MAETVIRIKQEEGYTVLPNGLLRDDRLSLKTKGLFCMMLSFPGDWSYSIGGLVAVCGAGRDAIRSALRELEVAGYLDRERSHNEDGRFGGMLYTLRTTSSAPQTENPPVADPDAPSLGFPTLDKPTSAEPTLENPTQQNKDYNNTPYSPPGQSGSSAASDRWAEGTMTRDGAPAQGKKRSKPAPDLTLFDRFWAAYPKKRAKDRALRAWRRLNPDLALCQIMSAALERAKASRDWQKDGGAYIPYPATWLNGRRWEDEDAGPVPNDDGAVRPEGGRWL